MIDTVIKILEGHYPEDLVEKLVASYSEIKQLYLLGKFKPSELEGGFFVECARRIIDLELFGTYIPIGKNLNILDDKEMHRYENGKGDESFRLHIPKALRTIYNLRNKRGVGHLSTVSPNLMDSTFIVATCDWVLAELLRLKANISPEECQRIIDNLVQRHLPLIFDNGRIQRVLDVKLPVKDQVLVLLYHNSEPLSDKKLIECIEYSNPSRFKTVILSSLHKSREIEYYGGQCEITPLGVKKVELLLTDCQEMEAL